MQSLRQETETCPCPVCRSDMAYIYPCESPVEVMVEMEIALVDIPENFPSPVSATGMTVRSQLKNPERMQSNASAKSE